MRFAADGARLSAMPPVVVCRSISVLLLPRPLRSGLGCVLRTCLFQIDTVDDKSAGKHQRDELFRLALACGLGRCSHKRPVAFPAAPAWMLTRITPWCVHAQASTPCGATLSATRCSPSLAPCMRAEHEQPGPLHIRPEDEALQTQSPRHGRRPADVWVAGWDVGRTLRVVGLCVGALAGVGPPWPAWRYLRGADSPTTWGRDGRRPSGDERR